MRVLVRAMGSAAGILAGLLAIRAPLNADTGTFQLFPPGSSANPLLSPDPDDGYAIFDSLVLLSDSRPASEVRLVLRIPESALSLHASESLPPPIVVNPKKPSLPVVWKPAATALVMATTVGYQLGNSLKETSRDGFHFTAEGFYGQNTYAGGVDKAAHFVDYTIAQRALFNTYRRIGYTDRQSGWLGFGTAMAAGLVNEIGDGTTIFGFSWEDLLMDSLGAGTATVLARTGWDDTFGFRFGAVNQQETPACCVDYTNIGRDYSGEIYTADVKIAGVARRLNVNPGPARFLLFSLTYGTNGYDTGSPEIRQRLVGFEIGIHFSEILRALGVPTEPVWGEVLYYFFDTLRIPYTAIGLRYDLNHNEWFGPNAGRTPFRVPAGSR